MALSRITSFELLFIIRVREALRVTLAVTKVDSLLRVASGNISPTMSSFAISVSPHHPWGHSFRLAQEKLPVYSSRPSMCGERDFL